MATFADMAVLLMAFFALLYSFSEINVREQANFAAAIRVAFGVERDVVMDDIQSATSMIDDSFSPIIAARSPMAGPQMTAPMPSKTYRSRFTDTEDGLVDFEKTYQALSETLSEELIQGDLVLQVEDDRIVVELRSLFTTGGDGDDEEDTTGARIKQSVIDVAAKVLSINSESDVQIDLRAQDLETPKSSDAENTLNLELHYEEIIDVLADEISNGAVEVILKDDYLYITLDSQDAFGSGQAQLNPSAVTFLSTIGNLLRSSVGRIRIEGHTDNMPLMFSESFATNWDLSTARASSVAAQFMFGSNISQSRLIVAGFSDSKPIEPNATKEGRAKNRRIEIIVGATPVEAINNG